MIKIIIEGPQGSGKTRLMNKIASMLKSESKNFICCEEVKEGNDFLIGDTDKLDFIIMTKQVKNG